MFNRVSYLDSAPLFTIVAFGVALAIFVAVSWRALRMKSAQVERFERLPLEDGERPAHHERS